MGADMERQGGCCRWRAAILMLVVATLTACERKEPAMPGGGAAAGPAETTVDPAVLSQVLARIEADLNQPVEAARTALLEASADAYIAPYELTVSDETQTVSIVGWLRRQGYLSDSPYGYGYELTPKGQALISGEAPVWIKAEGARPARLQCGSSGRVTAASCRIEVSVQPRLTERGRAALTGVSFAPQRVVANARYAAGEGWTVGDLQGADAGPPRAVVRRVIFGSEAQAEVEQTATTVETAPDALAGTTTTGGYTDQNAAVEAAAQAAAEAVADAAELQPEPMEPEVPAEDGPQ
jgi:hypothetical protein